MKKTATFTEKDKTLRRFRDYTLAESWYGRAFIRTYYAISPTLVKWFGETNWFKKMWKGKQAQFQSIEYKQKDPLIKE